MAKEVEKLKTEIERLRKELKRRKKYGLVWEEKPEEVVEMCKEKLPVLKEVKNKEIITDKDKPVNLLIEGDNYHALSVLNYTHAKKVDVIYIDPPYNTGAKNWKYNNRYVEKEDAFRHSKWLSMMEKRLSLAKNVLKTNGCLICAIDENEHANLVLLLKQIFPGHNIDSITVVHNPRGVQGKNFSYNHEYAVFVYPNSKEKYISNAQRESTLVRNFRVDGSNSPRNTAKTCFYPFIIKDEEIIGVGEVAPKNFHPKKQTVEIKKGVFQVWPIDVKDIERKWSYSRNTVEQIIDQLSVKKRSKGFEIYRSKEEAPYRTVWIDPKYDANEYGSKLVNSITGVQFPFPKSLYTVKECLKAVVKNKKDAIILDFFAGSGTTGQAVLEMNKEDGGRRKFIICTNNEGNIAIEVCYPRIKNVIKGYKKYGNGELIKGLNGNLKYFKTDFVDYDEPTDKNKIKLTAEATEMLCVKEGTFDKVLEQRYFKIFKNTNHYTGIIFDQAAIAAFKKAIKVIKGKFSVYIFSLCDETFDEEFEDVKQEIQLSPIPEVILRVYRRIFK